MGYKPMFFAICTTTLLLTGCDKSDISEHAPLKLPAVRSHISQMPAPIKVIGVRKFPGRYDAMLAICSDADHMTLRKFNIIHEFLNTTEDTPLGKGLGLDVSDSFFMYNGTNIDSPVDYGNEPIADMMTWFEGVSKQPYMKDAIDHYIQAGWMDSIHTYGDFSMKNQNQTLFSRQLAETAIDALNRSGDKVTVWIDHGNQSNVDNFGSYGVRKFFNYQQGANPWSRYYHTDLAIPYGIRFVWADQNYHQLGINDPIYPIKLPDGRKLWGFKRFTDDGSTKGDVNWVWNPRDLHKQLSISSLQSIERNHQFAVVAQHLCGNNDEGVLPQSAVDSLRVLAKEYDRGAILVARTSRLLQYDVSRKYVQYRVRGNVIDILSTDDPVLGKHVPTLDEVRGITFYVDKLEPTVIAINHQEISSTLVQYNATDGYHPSVEIAWFPPDTGNHAVL